MKPHAALLDPIRRPEVHAPGDGAAVAAWHAGWAAAVGVTALVATGAMTGQVSGAASPVLLALAVMTGPGLAGLILLRRDTDEARSALMTLWMLAALSAAALSGGAGGPLSGFVFAPLAAGLALGGRRRVLLAALAATGATAAGLLSGWLLGAPPTATTTASVSALVVAGAATAALILGARRAARRFNTAAADVAGVETLLAGQPGLTLALDEDLRALAAYGAAPAALPVEPLFKDGLLSAVDAADRPAVLVALARARSVGEAQVRFTPRLALDRRILLAARRMGEGPRLIVQALDATLQYAREVELDAARVEAEAQSAGKSRFLAHMSHELRTPLNAVIGFSDAMRQELFGPVPPRYADYARSIHEAGGHLLDLISDVLDVSRIEADRYELSLERFDVRETVAAALALVRLQAEDKGVELTSVLPSEPLMIQADRRALKQMTLNLLSNAVKFTPAGGTVTATAQTAGTMLELTIADTGVGIAKADLARLGRPYEQAGEAAQKAKGTGLGLALVRALAQLHDGTMSLDSTLGEGTAAALRLPVLADV
ncbi:HAMP domain-containing sensor histidine kinase [Brevundimonas sp.]|uniref:sensor histidine kinase n=1 Tax=Brevundimonas sp. TaxID=1871086 RepID=UPI0028AC46B0|nr:HAMP domain-containing sensor histidine kinase [Brevundimonas sp.]